MSARPGKRAAGSSSGAAAKKPRGGGGRGAEQAASTDGGLARMSAAYRAWAAERGIRLHPHVALTWADGWSFEAARGVAAGELLLAVPSASALDLSPTRPAVAHLLALGVPPLCASAVLLADVLEQREAGPLGPHAQVLRSIHVDNILDWRTGEGQLHARLLRGTSLEALLRTMPLRARFRELVVPALRTSDAALLPGLRAAFTEELSAKKPAKKSAAHSEEEQEGTPLIDALVHAAALIMSRCFHASPAAASSAGSGGAAASGGPAAPPHLLPVADFFNHHPTRAVTSNARVGDEFRFYALRPVAAGDQVYLSYGALSDAQLAHTYGFAPMELPASGAASPPPASPPSRLSQPWNPHNTVTVPAHVLVATLRAKVAGGGRARAGKHFDRAISSLRATGLLPAVAKGHGAAAAAAATSGFTLSMSDAAIDEGLWAALETPPPPPPHTASRASASSSSASSSSSRPRSSGESSTTSTSDESSASSILARGRALEALVPTALLTAVQLATCGDDATVSEYVAACTAHGSHVALRIPAPSSMLQALGLLPPGVGGQGVTAATSVAAPAGSRSGGGSRSAAAVDEGAEEEEELEPEDILEAWSHTLAILAAALREYPSTLPADLAWEAGCTRLLASAPRDPNLVFFGGPQGSQDSPWAWSPKEQVVEGARDAAYRACRLVALREKQLLAAAIAAIDSELRLASELMSAGDSEGDSDV